jgi:broad specificity phosphatase PhoE
MIKLRNFYFVRHGSTSYNHEHRLQGQCDRSAVQGISDQPLTETGYKEAHAAVQAFVVRGVRLQAILSSPLLRAAQTAEVLAKHFPVPIHYGDGLKEMFFGELWEGMVSERFAEVVFTEPHVVLNPVTGGEIAMRSGADVRSFHKRIEPDYDLVSHPGGESKKEVRERALLALSAFVSSHPQIEEIAVPTHNALLRFVLSPISPQQAERTVRTGEIVHITYDPQLETWRFVRRF